MPEIPCDQVIYLVKRGQRDVDRVGHKLSMKDPARDISFGQDRYFFGKFELLERLYKFEITRPVGF